MPALGVGGGEVFVEVGISNRGLVTDVRPLRTTAGFTDLVVRTVQGWQFLPAEVEVDPEPGQPATPRPRRPVASKALVAVVFRPPALVGPTLGETPKDVASESEGSPFPLTTSLPLYSPLALLPGVVMVEVQIGAQGTANNPTIVRSAPPFDEPTLVAARQWTFRPARVRGRAVASRAYLVFVLQPPTGPIRPSVGPTPPPTTTVPPPPR